MFRRLILVAAAVGMTATGAHAESCGSAPIAPALPTAADLNAKTAAAADAAKHDAFVEIRNWQNDLKDYRACLVNVSNGAKRQIAGLNADKDKDKIAGLKADASRANHEYDDSVDMEERVVNEFHAVQAAYCARKDVDKSSCPK
ncbi:MAG TPA: hypothetical protein VHU18_13375 [Rhizomicrobium sp.]|jgi:hypothetical protein|nr:hypothetical protein [Rhizomicrobium sp.]